MNLRKEYPIGTKVLFPHPFKPDVEEAEVVAHVLHSQLPEDGFRQEPTAIRVKFADGEWTDISENYL
jgi:hypothetical protein